MKELNLDDPTFKWELLVTDCFYFWLCEQDKGTKNCILSALERLRLFGPYLARPYADHIKGSNYKNMKELRVQYQGKVIRAFFAFDPLRKAIVLCAGDKSNDKLFYEKMLKLADKEFKNYLASLEE
ncbi:addiction module toxin RelE [Mannheimia granulomatis]|uniref:Addiction module toxin RelE n=1 Tax=Mannheimia granulomatis TaxID=85402 RepID=A0A6G8JIX5_9PAST|nr:type II toxin-antitoxin system RelE/ParE family toxin [Mannheimia granulomatis]QIM66798.1 addiction module toxin RelE [Mannheimia granulomatis]